MDTLDHSLRILIVDEVAAARYYVAKVCLELGFGNVRAAASIDEAWELLNGSEDDFDLIISDLDPILARGIEFLRQIRRNVRYSEVAFIALTSDSSLRIAAEAAKAGADRYLLKPFSIHDLREDLLSLERRSRRAA